MGDPSAGKARKARVLDVSGSGMRLEVALPVPCGAAVEIEDPRTLVLGETLRCDPKSDGYMVAIRVLKTVLIDGSPAAPR